MYLIITKSGWLSCEEVRELFGVGKVKFREVNCSSGELSVEDEELVGKFCIDANPIIIDRLKNTNSLIQYIKITRSVANDWRTENPVIIFFIFST